MPGLSSVMADNQVCLKTRNVINIGSKVLIRLYLTAAKHSRYYPNTPPRLLNLSKRLAKHTKQLATYDPLVQEMSEVASLDADYLLLLSAIENKVEI